MKKPQLPMCAVEREQVIDLLVDDWFDSLSSNLGAMNEFIREALTVGRVGYFNHEDQELVDLASAAELFDEGEVPDEL